METFIASMEQARRILREQIPAVSRALSAADVDRSRIPHLREIENWLEEEIPRLRGRNEMIRAAELAARWDIGANGPGSWGVPSPGGGGLVAFDEKRFATYSTARAEGGKLAESFLRLPHTTTRFSEDDYGRVFGELTERRDDAAFTSAFFSVVGPGNTVRVLRELNNRDVESLRENAKTLGTALAGAVTRQPGVLGTAWEPESLRKVPSDDLGLLLGHGRFPTGWLAAVVGPRIGKSAGKDDSKGGAGKSTGNGGSKGGADELKHLLPALADNPETARTLFNDMRPEDLRTLFSELNAQVSLYPNDHSEIAFDLEAEFGRMLAAGAGVFEKRSPGPEAVRFAFNVMTTVGDLRTRGDFRRPEGEPTEVAPGARIFMSMLAGAYAAEITEGANAGDANRTMGSALEKTTSLTAGLHPKFRLSPGDTYRFLKIFADSAERMKPFEAGMGRLAVHLMNEAGAKDRGSGIKHLGNTFASLGYVSGMQLAAANEVRGKMDEFDQEQRDRLFFLLGLGVDFAGFGATALGLVVTSFDDAVWLMLSKPTSETIDSFKDIDTTRLDRLKESDRLATLGREYWIFHLLRHHGFSYTVPPDDPAFGRPPITGKDGNLLPFKDLAKNPKALKNLADWLIRNGSGSGDLRTAGGAATQLDVFFGGAKDKTQHNPVPFG
ncbi:hypothetical protein ACLQ2R_24720 [Streptosporangium sp. DT93]|uniref:hypothetical protein n=1 Tax=Streptosporangium sp. DT93 TaxID=3393428 RepID=UPI003CF64EB2